VRARSPDSILCEAARYRAKKKIDDGAARPASMVPLKQDDSEVRMTLDAVRLNAMLIALLATASMINGIIVYSYL
jgi:hypothetical protein